MTTLSTNTTLRTDAMLRMRRLAARPSSGMGSGTGSGAGATADAGAGSRTGAEPGTGAAAASGGAGIEQRRLGAKADTRPPLLDAETERALLVAWKQHGDRRALDRLVSSFQALVTRVAGQYRTAGVAYADLVSEGNVGLLHAIDKFDLDRGFRLSTYAVWWIRAVISELALTGASLVKGVTSERHRRVLFNLRRIKARLGEMDGLDLSPEATSIIAGELGVDEADVIHVHGWATARELSVNVGLGGGDDSRSDWQDTLVDPADDPETAVINDDEWQKRQVLVREAIATLDPRERQIIACRHLADEPEKLADISRRFGVSRERVRQIEMRALNKLRRRVAARVAEPPVAAPLEHGPLGSARSARTVL